MALPTTDSGVNSAGKANRLSMGIPLLIMTGTSANGLPRNLKNKPNFLDGHSL
ncbi:MAG: hypothetical protein J5X22_06920 [Candidatus Accumulibacter sp.]|uniref:Uncharacterized protein n=1 Tax=Candidatus Accumulibacter cognatus TaxID=2954383 RepID=A0A7D5S8V3_9PROT|nr:MULTISPECIES: hypothetical protein [Candidatus Accumulibacter]QLH49140.1 MAG: hypothetical protein HWD57_04610 [Candidatus Accumulibacter cognatus]MBN8520056.1 hypothetical protein [Accumulibacter sp.]MBO3710249.1 hypothetical protein [Accumulibacter sp.]MCC2867749.1 hypothetical protein [Candidatus Accumulibacter phosphatis]MCM8623870.1 hypothetical protein [Accumulibacter sp.]